MRVIECGTMIAGLVAATLLAGFGAEVIKIEQPGGGDHLRKIGPFVDVESPSLRSMPLRAMRAMMPRRFRCSRQRAAL